MKFYNFLFIVFAVFIVACGKDKFQTIPSISIKSINSKTVPANGTLVVTLECTDKEGDVQDSVVIIKNRLNRRVVATIRDTLGYNIPKFPSTHKVEIETSLDYQTILSAINPPTIPGSNPAQKESDTLRLKFVVRDNAGHTSDTISTEPIIVIRQ